MVVTLKDDETSTLSRISLALRGPNYLTKHSYDTETVNTLDSPENSKICVHQCVLYMLSDVYKCTVLILKCFLFVFFQEFECLEALCLPC